MSNDELQKAIDDITSSDNTGGVALPGDNGVASVALPTDIGQATNGAVNNDTNELENFAGAAPKMNVGGDSFGMPMMPPSGANDITEDAAAREIRDAASANMDKRPEIATGFGTRAKSVPVGDASGESQPVGGAELGQTMGPETTNNVAENVAEIKMPEISEAGPVDPELKEVETAALIELYPLLAKMNVNPREKFDICMKVLEKTGEKGATSAALDAAKEIVDEAEKGECLVKLVEKIENM